MEPLVICPGCRRLDGDLHLQTLEPGSDVLACACGRRYPIVDGVPIVLADPGGYLSGESTAVLERDVPLAVAAALVEHGADDAPYARLLEHVSIYVDAHWGDRADPPESCAAAAILDRLARRPHVAAAVELGCSAGRIAAELARTADHVMAVDLQFATLRRARHLLAGEPLAYGRRMIGRHYAPVTTHAGDLATDRVRLLCSDALDPPLVPGHYDRVVALNLLDSVRQPATLLAVMDGLCAPGGEVILSSPYSWQSGIVDDGARLGGADPAAAVAGWFANRGYRLEDQDDLPWSLRRDTRSVVTYRTHYVRVRKPAAPQTV